MRHLILFLFLHFCFSISATNIDSLLLRIDEVEKEEKVELMISLAKALRNSNPIMAMSYANQALELSQKINFQKGEANSYYNLGVLYAIKGEYPKSNSYINKGLDAFQKIGDKEGEANCWIALGKNIYRNDKPTKAIKYFQKAYDYYQDSENYEALASIYLNTGNAYWYLTALDSTQANYEKALAIAREHGLKNIYSLALGNLALVCKLRGDFVKAVKYYLEALEIVEEQGDFENLALTRLNFAITLKNVELFDISRKYIEQAKAYYDSTDNQRSIALCLDALADIWDKQGEERKALDYYLQENAIYNKIGIKRTGTVLGNIGNAYRKLGILDSARVYIEKSLVSSKSFNNGRRLAYYYFQSGLLDLAEKDSTSAEKNFLEAITLSKELNLLPEKGEISSFLASLFRQKQEFEKASYFQKLSAEISDSLYRLEKSNELNRLLVQDELKKKELKIEELDTALINEQSRIDRLLFKNDFNQLIMIALVSFLLLIIIRYIQLLKKNRRLASEINKNLLDTKTSDDVEVILFAENGKDKICFELKHLLFIEANGNYIIVQLKNNRHSLRTKLTKAEEQLTQHTEIVRTHRAFLLNTQNIQEVEGNAQGLKIKLKYSNLIVPVSRTYLLDFKKTWKKLT